MGTSDDAQDAGQAENDLALMVADANKEIGREKGAPGADALAIFPDFFGQAGGEEGVDLALVEEAADGPFASGHGAEREPAGRLLRSRGEKGCVFLPVDWANGHFRNLCEPASKLFGGRIRCTDRGSQRSVLVLTNLRAVVQGE